MNSREGRQGEAFEMLPEAEAREMWITLLDRAIAGLMFAIVVTLCIPLCSLFYH